MNIPTMAPRPRLFRCVCGLVGKVPLGAFNVRCKSCGRIFVPPAPAPNQTREMQRNMRRMEKQSKGENPK